MVKYTSRNLQIERKLMCRNYSKTCQRRLMKNMIVQFIEQYSTQQ